MARSALIAWRSAVLGLLVLVVVYLHHHDTESAQYDSLIWSALPPCEWVYDGERWWCEDADGYAVDWDAHGR